MDDYLARDASAMEFEDIIPAIVEYGRADGQQLGIPFRWLTNMLYYRKDLFDAAGLEIPKTLEEFVAAGKALSNLTGDPTTSVYGIVQRGKTVELAHDWLNFFYSAGGDFFSEDGGCGLNSPAGVEVSQMFRDLFQEGIFEPDIFAWGRDDYITAMQQGRAAMGVYTSAYWGRLIDPVDSTVTDKMAWALPPSKPGVPQGRTRGGGWMLTINKFSETPEAAWELIKWITNKENTLREAVEWANGPVRISTFESEEYLSLFPLAIDWLEATKATVTDPAHPAVPKIQEAIAIEVTAVMSDEKTAEEGMIELCQQFDNIMEDYE
jgi:multiple sugar transport system substrate-binding protein